MATGEQVKALIKAHYDQDNERFKTAALRIAASETRIGHTTLGREITAMIDASTRTKGNATSSTSQTRTTCFLSHSLGLDWATW